MGAGYMHADYMDIRRRIQGHPVWWDQNGCPRFDAFRPEDSPNVYAEECALLRVRCPACLAEFDVEVNHGPLGGRDVLGNRAVLGDLTYTNPPRHDCEGDTMQSKAVRVLEFWKRGEALAWGRARWLEGAVNTRPYPAKRGK